ncbi:MAG: 4Fe-4S dicluster domain-containing protein [Candidatus Latescibacteria bacterium]|jgi:Na(+)-translocating NADH:ubiquinone oxidoreductase A subunit|nr:4Fe-4S dicluster domain-containing protein [Candidatus Latescibacterota bacterium]
MKFPGGYKFKNFEGMAEPILRELPVPETVFIPLNEKGLINQTPTFTPSIEKGDTVRAGERLLQSDSEPLISIASPVNGTVTGCDEDGITISSDGTEGFEPVEGHTRAPWHLGREDAFNLSCSSGCILLFNDSFSSLSDLDRVKHIIINAVHNSPLNQSWSPGITGDPNIFYDGIRTLKVLFPESEIIIAVNKRNMKFFNTPEIKEHASAVILSGRYPQEHPELLSRDTVHKRLVSPEGVYDSSILLIQFLDVIRIAETMTRGRPFIDRILMIAGPGVSRPGWYRVRIGTPFEAIRHHLLKSDDYGPWRIVRGGILTGESVVSPDASVQPADTEISVIREYAVRDLYRFINPGFTYDSYSRTTAAEYIPLLPKQLDSNVHGGVRPCVQCNYCDEVCPVGIYPHLIRKYVVADRADESFRFRPYDCIECGLCDYVCPSKIDIASDVVKAKEEYHTRRREIEISD